MRTGLLQSVHLIERIELHELDAGGPEDLLARDDGEDLFHLAVRAAVTVVMRIGEQRAGGIEQGEIHPPRVQPQRSKLILAGGEPQPLLHLLEQTQHIPVQPIGNPHGDVRKPVNHLKIQNVSAQLPHHRASTLGPEIQREE